MKFSAAILALCAINASAFAPASQNKAASALFSSPFGTSDTKIGSSTNGAPPFPTQPSFGNDGPGGDNQKVKALEARLAQLERSPGSSGSRTPSYESFGASGIPLPDEIREKTAAIAVQGGSLKTWSYASPLVERVKVCLGTEGRPLDADIELWQGPDNTPHKMRVYAENGNTRPFSAIVETPRGPNTIAIRNIGQLEFPLAAHVVAETTGPSVLDADFANPAMTIQGGALRTFPFDPNVESVQVLLRTDGRPLNARIELMQGPNNNKQVMELYTEDGMDRPFYVVLETPGSGNVVRVVNSATVEFPLTASVEPYLVANKDVGMEPVIGGDPDGYFFDRDSPNSFGSGFNTGYSGRAGF